MKGRSFILKSIHQASLTLELLELEERYELLIGLLQKTTINITTVGPRDAVNDHFQNLFDIIQKRNFETPKRQVKLNIIWDDYFIALLTEVGM